MLLVLTLLRYCTKASLLESEHLIKRLEASIDTLNTLLERGDQVYGAFEDNIVRLILGEV